MTIAHNGPDDALDRAFEELADFNIAFTVDAFHLYELGTDGVWRPKHDFRLGAAAQGE